MNFVRSLTGSVTNTWNSINPATLSGAVDVIVVEREDGTLASSAFHVRFGKYQILRPSNKRVDFRVNGDLKPYAMKLGEGGEAFFIFETTSAIPAEFQTSPLASPSASPEQSPLEAPSGRDFDEPEPFDLDGTGSMRRRTRMSLSIPPTDNFTMSAVALRPQSGDWSGLQMHRAHTDEVIPSAREGFTDTVEDNKELGPLQVSKEDATAWNRARRATSPPPVSPKEAMARAVKISKKLLASNIPHRVTDSADIELDMTGYKSSEESAILIEKNARDLLNDELEGVYDVGALFGADERGNIWIYSSEEAKATAMQKLSLDVLNDAALRASDAASIASDPGYQSDSGRSEATAVEFSHMGLDSDSTLGGSAPQSPEAQKNDTMNYAKTLRLTTDQLEALNLKPGANTMSFTVNKSTCTASLFFWKHDVPVVISDIDGTITKSDALGHILTAIGRDWTHQGVAKLYTDIVNNGYNIMYLTSRSNGQADSTRTYLNGIVQEDYRLPAGPVIMSPDRTYAALHREVVRREPQIFKIKCLRDIMQLFGKPMHQTPFYAGFGNRFTDALSYRSVNIPSIRIFTINSNAEVSLDVLALNSYKTGYASMREIVDHFFPPVGLLVPAGGEDYTDFNYWRDKPLDIEDFTDSEEDDDGESDTEAGSVRSEDEGSEVGEDLEASYMTQDSMDEAGMEDSIIESVEGDYYDGEEEEEEEEGEEYIDDEDEDDEVDGGIELDGTPTSELDPITQGVGILDVKDSTPTPRGSPRK